MAALAWFFDCTAVLVELYPVLLLLARCSDFFPARLLAFLAAVGAFAAVLGRLAGLSFFSVMVRPSWCGLFLVCRVRLAEVDVFLCDLNTILCKLDVQVGTVDNLVASW